MKGIINHWQSGDMFLFLKHPVVNGTDIQGVSSNPRHSLYLSLYISMSLLMHLPMRQCCGSTVHQPRSWQLPWWVEKFDFVSFGPLGKHSLFCDETVPSIWSTLVEHILGTFISTTWLIIVVGDLPYTLGSIRGRKEKKDHFTQMINSVCLPVITLKHFLTITEFTLTWEMCACSSKYNIDMSYFAMSVLDLQHDIVRIKKVILTLFWFIFVNFI